MLYETEWSSQETKNSRLGSVALMTRQHASPTLNVPPTTPTELDPSAATPSAAFSAETRASECCAPTACPTKPRHPEEALPSWTL